MASIFNSYFNGDDGDDTDNDDDGDGDGDAQCGSKQWVVAGGAAVFESECKAQTFIPGLCYSGYCTSITMMMTVMMMMMTVMILMIMQGPARQMEMQNEANTHRTLNTG